VFPAWRSCFEWSVLLAPFVGIVAFLIWTFFQPEK